MINDLMSLGEEEPQIGMLYHTIWATKNGYVWKCIDINKENKTVQLQTPKTKKNLKYRTKWADLRFTRNEQLKRTKSINKEIIYINPKDYESTNKSN